MGFFTERMFPVLSVGLAVLLACAFTMEIKATTGNPGNAGAPERLEPPISLPRSLPSITSYAALSETPLFNASRHPDRAILAQPTGPPATMPLEAPVTPVQVSSPYKLIGTLYIGSSGVAVLRDTTTQRTVRARLGASLNDWHVQSLVPRNIVLEHQGQAVKDYLPARTRAASGASAAGAVGSVAAPEIQAVEGMLPQAAQPGVVTPTMSGQ